MKVLLLGPSRPIIEQCIGRSGDVVQQMEERLHIEHPILEGVEFIVSYGYRYMVPADVLARFASRAVNLHISLLPWNRGADPNLWSYLENTPKGVTIHVLDSGLDTGPILAQIETPFLESDTLRTSYESLTKHLESLFCDLWPELRRGDAAITPQHGGGTIHRSAEKQAYEHLLTNGWDTPVMDLVGRALKG
ncbi:MAG: formyltransferase family protein, partial [Actinomycetota bacterium]|nr:formyltransferase family protein [Actinomycetota bacterium]